MVGRLHRAASEWFEQEGYAVEAVRHAQLARDWPHAARLLFDSRIGLILDGRLATLRALLDGFPARVAAADPELAVVFAGVRLRDGSFDDADAYIAVAERNAEDVPEDRKQLFGLHLASVRLALARQRGDLGGAVQAMRSLESALESQPPNAAGRTDDIRALALMTLGTTELWSLRLADARRHLEEGLALARRIGRPYLEIGCLAHLGIAAPLSGLSASVALDFTEEAVAIAEAHGLATNPIVALAFAVGAGSLAWLGRFDEAEQWLERAGLALRPGGDPGTELALYHARGLLYSGQGRLEDALAEFRSAEKIQGDARRRARAHGRPARAHHADAGPDGPAVRCARRARQHRRAGPRPSRGADPGGRDSPRRGQPGAGDRAARAGHRALRRVADPDVGGHPRPTVRRRRP